MTVHPGGGGGIARGGLQEGGGGTSEGVAKKNKIHCKKNCKQHKLRGVLKLVKSTSTLDVYFDYFIGTLKYNVTNSRIIHLLCWCIAGALPCCTKLMGCVRKCLIFC